MGYELQKLMNMFGVSTPTIANYSGTQNPGTAPTAPTAPVLGANPTNFQRAQYAKDLAAYNTANQKYTTDKAAFDENVRKYGLDQAQYDQYRQDYQNRLANTNMYNQAQFSTTGANVPPISQPPAGNVYTPPPVMQQPGTQYGAPQWTDTIKPPDYSSSVANPPAVNTGNNNANLLSLITGNNNAANVPAVNTVNSGTANVPAVNTGNSAIRFLLAALGGNRAATGKDLLAYIDAGNGPGQSRDKAHGGYIKNYATGGAVQGYQEGGLEARGIAPPANITSRRIYDDPFLEGAAQAIDRADPAIASDPAPVDDRTAALQAMLDQYGPQNVDYAAQIGAARERQANEQRAFEDMLHAQLNSPEDAAASKAEMYFRLAAAFGAPTKTGNFSENLAMAGNEMADTAKSQREARANKLGVQLELQKMRLGAADKELDTLRALESENMRDKRSVAQEMLREYVQSGKPQSAAGKAALDMGLQPGTPEFQAKVQELTELQIQREMAGIEAQLAAAAATTTKTGQMSATEIKLRTDTENKITGIDQALQNVKEAYSLNPNSFAGSWADKGQNFLLEGIGSKDPIVVNTARINNLLGTQALEKLRATFGGNPTEGERAILMDLQGIGAKSLEERKQIMMQVYDTLQNLQAAESKRLQDILSGSYRTYVPLDVAPEVAPEGAE